MTRNLPLLVVTALVLCVLTYATVQLNRLHARTRPADAVVIEVPPDHQPVRLIEEVDPEGYARAVRLVARGDMTSEEALSELYARNGMEYHADRTTD